MEKTRTGGGNSTRGVGLGLTTGYRFGALIGKGKGIRRKEIDYSDIRELSQRQLAGLRRVGRPTIGDGLRKLIAIRSDPRILQTKP